MCMGSDGQSVFALRRSAIEIPYLSATPAKESVGVTYKIASQEICVQRLADMREASKHTSCTITTFSFSAALLRLEGASSSSAESSFPAGLGPRLLIRRFNRGLVSALDIEDELPPDVLASGACNG